MKQVHKIGVIALLYILVLFLTLLIIYDANIALWGLLGGMVAMFNYGQMLRSTKALKKGSMYTSISIRFLMVLVIMAYTFFKSSKEFQIRNMILVLLGLIAVKVGVIVFYLLPFRKEEPDHDSAG